MNRFVFLQGSLCCPLFSGTVCKHLAGGCLPTTLPVQQETGEFSQGLLQRIGKYLQLVFLGTHLAVVLLPVPVKRIWRLDTSFLLGSELRMEVGYLVPRWLLDSNVSWYAWATSAAWLSWEWGNTKHVLHRKRWGLDKTLTWVSMLPFMSLICFCLFDKAKSVIKLLVDRKQPDSRYGGEKWF